MRWSLALIACTCLVLLPVGQSVTWDDPAGDQEMSRSVAYGPGAPEREWFNVGDFGWYPQADVLSASIDETAEQIIFEVRLSAVDSTATEEAPFPDAHFPEWSYAWSFTYDGDPLVASFDIWDGDDEFVWFGVYEIVPMDGYLRYVYRLGWLGEPLDDEAGYRAVIPKAYWRNGDGVPLREGHVLEDVTFRAGNSQRWFAGGPCMSTDPTGNSPFDCGWQVRDLLADGDSLGDVVIEKTPPQVGHLFARFEDPVRQSNGLATTYVFELDLHNLEPVAETALLQVQDIPQGWEIHHPPAIAFDGQDKTVVPIAVTVPFQHAHGESKWMRLTVLSQHDPEATVDLPFGVVFADPAQPAGHHDTLYFHADSEGWWGWMNTRKDDPEGPGSTIRPSSMNYGATEIRAGWQIHLNPGLDIGLDFVVSETAELRVPIEFGQDFEGEIRARLLLQDWSDGSSIRLADGTLQDFSAAAGTPAEAQISLAIESIADRVPPQRSSNLVLMINATGQALPTVAFNRDVALHTEDASLRLPLVDYHEEVDLTGLVQPAFDITPRNRSYQAVNPGKTAVMAFNVTSLLNQQTTLDWEVRGIVPYIEWVDLTAPTTHLRPGGQGIVAIEYAPPSSAKEGDIAEFVLLGTARGSDAQQVFTRAVFFIETDEEIPDQAEDAKQLRGEADAANARNRNESPAPAVVLVGIALLAMAMIRRQR